jgi:hypothetical protein
MSKTANCTDNTSERPSARVYPSSRAQSVGRFYIANDSLVIVEFLEELKWARRLIQPNALSVVDV